MARVKTATCLFRDSDYYRKAEFCAGLQRHGYAISEKHLANPGPNDVLLLWNRNRGFEPIAERYERAGATVLIAENGYLGQPPGGGKFYALAVGQHNGAGRWYVGDAPRFPVDEKPWRERGDHILILPQRGIGSQSVRMPSSWVGHVTRRLKAITDRPIRVRQHPGHKKTDPLPDLLNCHAAITWGSGAGIKALAYGYPVFHDFDKWIGSAAARRLADDVESCDMPDRTELWRRVTWAQWALSELASGEAFDRLLHVETGSLFRP